MAGHSHWAGIKHKKGALDKKRGKLFSKLSKHIIVSVKEGGGITDPSANLKLRYAIEKAKEGNMPKANIERAVQKGAGIAKGGAGFSEILYEGYGSGGVAVMAEVITDNRNRAASELRKLFEKKGGKLGESGCVSYMFEKKGVIVVSSEAIEEEKLMDLVLEAGAEDMEVTEECYEIKTSPGDLQSVKEALEKAEIPLEVAEVSLLPTTTITLDERNSRKVLNLIQALEDYDDIDSVYANYDIPDELMNKLENE